MSDTQPNHDATSKKRQRTDADEPVTGSEEEVVKDTQVWLPDGNIVLISKTIAFRVHKSVLSLRSEVFRDLFLLPPLSAGEKAFEGCPTVRISDTPDDLRHLLLVVCGGKDYYHENDEVVPVPCKVLCSLVRMGHKYAIPKVLNDALSRLKKYYTSDLSTWDDVTRRNRYVRVSSGDHVLAMRVAHLTNTPSILPTAFLDMADWSGDKDILALSKCTAECQCGLTPELVQQAIRGRAAIIEHMATHRLAVHAAVPSPECATPGRCPGVAHEILREVLQMGVFHFPCRISRALSSLYKSHWFGHHERLCPACMNASKKTDEDQRIMEWRGLPSFFELKIDGWPTA